MFSRDRSPEHTSGVALVVAVGGAIVAGWMFFTWWQNERTGQAEYRRARGAIVEVVVRSEDPGKFAEVQKVKAYYAGSVLAFGCVGWWFFRRLGE